MNAKIKAERDSKVRIFNQEEFLICLGLMVGAANFEHQGKQCWVSNNHAGDDFDDGFLPLAQHSNFDRFISYPRFKDFRRFLPTIWSSEEKRISGDPWWQISDAIDTFNSIRREKICKSNWARKPEPLGTEFKCVADPESGCMMAIELQRGKDGMRNQEFNAEIGNTGGCTLRLMNSMNCNGERECTAVKGDAWFGSVKNCSNLKLVECI